MTFPLDEENLLKFHSAREGLMEHVHTESKGFDLKNEDTKKSLREKTTSNQVRRVQPCERLRFRAAQCQGRCASTCSLVVEACWCVPC